MGTRPSKIISKDGSCFFANYKEFRDCQYLVQSIGLGTDGKARLAGSYMIVHSYTIISFRQPINQC